MQRETFKLTSEERARFYRLRPIVGEAFDFWKGVAKARDLDYKTIYYLDGEYSGLPVEKHWSVKDLDRGWCWPIPLKCKIKPENVEI